MDAHQSQPSWAPPIEAAVSDAATLSPSDGREALEPVQTPVITRAYERSFRPGPELVGTSATRVLAAAGWFGSTAAFVIAALTLSKSYRHITGENWRAALDEIQWLMPLLISSFGMAYLGWVVWTTLAAMNGHRVAPLASSPWMPPVAYLLGPVAAFAGSTYKPEANGSWLAGAIVWVFLGHGLVLMSLRSAARRIGADSRQFTKLICFPLASLGYCMIATTVLPETSFYNTSSFAVLILLGLLLMMATAIAVMRAMHSFDHACARDRHNSVENQLPAFMAGAHR